MKLYRLEPKNKTEWMMDHYPHEPMSKLVAAPKVGDARKLAGINWLNAKTVLCTEIVLSEYQQPTLLAEDAN